MSSKGGSKIPYRQSNRGHISTSKSPKYIPSPAAKRLGLLVPRKNGRGSPGSSPLSQPPETLKDLALSPTNLNKPLPSPPVAQVISPEGVLEAKRTLVDATVAGNSLEGDWPALQPNSVEAAVLVDAITSAEKENHTYTSYTRKSSTNSDYRRSAELRSKNPYASLIDATNPRITPPALPTCTQGGKSYPGAFRTLGSDASPTLAKPRGTALESPLARKPYRREGVIRPSATTHGWKRGSIPSPKPPITAAEASVVQQGAIKSRPTKWPLPGVEIDAESTPARAESQVVNADFARPASSIQGGPQRAGESAETYLISLSQQPSQTSLSTLGGTRTSELDNDFSTEASTRRKHLSNNPLTATLGPVLTIAHDADKFILGDENQTPDATAIQQATSKQSFHNRTLGALTGRISPQNERISFNKGSRSIALQPFRSGDQENGPTPVVSARPMQPQMKGHDGIYSKNSSCASVVSRDENKVNTQNALASESKDHTEDCTAAEVLLENTALPGQEVVLKESLPLTQDKENDTNVRPLSALLKNPSMLPPTHSRSGRSATTSLGETKTITPTMTDSRFCKSSQSTQSSGRDSPRLLGLHIANTHPTAMTTSKLKNVESTAPKYGDIHNRRHRQHTRDQSATIPLACSSEDSKDSSKGSNDLGAKIKLKRSIRSMFQKDGKSNNVTIIPAKSKKSSITAARSTLAKRFRTSTNLSRVTLPKEVEAHADSTSYVANEATGYQFSAKHLGEGRTWEGQPVPTATPRKDGPDDILPVPILSDVSNLAGSTSAIWPPNQPSATNTINKILERIKDLPPGSKEHLAGLHVAEAITHCIEQSQQAKIAAQKAEQYAREAQLHSNTADINLKWLGKLCERSSVSDALNETKEQVSK